MRTSVSLLLVLLLLSAPAFGQGKKKKKEAEKPVEAPVVVEGAPDPKCGEAPFGMESAEIYSVFVESAKTKDFETALLYGPWLACAHPKKMAGLPTYSGDKMYEKLAEVYEGIALKRNDPSGRSRYLDSASWAYGKIFEVYAGGGIDLFQAHLDRGRFFQKNADFIDNGNDKAFSDYEAMFKLDKKRISELAEGYYVQAILVNMVANSRKEEALAVITDSEPFAGPALKEAFNQIRDRLFSNPEERVVFLQEKVKTTPNDLVVLNEYYDVLLKLKRNDEARVVSESLYKLDPSFVNTERMGDNFESKGDYKNAIKYYSEALGKAKTDAEKTDVYLKMVDNYINTSDLKTAREFARKTLAVDSKSSKAYLAIARIYAQAVSICGTNLEREDKVVYWLAMDYVEKAKSVDPSVAGFADQQLKSFKTAAPDAEAKFFKAWKDGQRIRVDASLKACYGWIGEETTIR